jgi:hypothetical protein
MGLVGWQCFNIATKWLEGAKSLVLCSDMPDPAGLRKVATVRCESKMAEVLKDMQEAFNFFDKDGSGSISTSELGAMLRILGINMTNSELQEIISLNDVNNDGLMDFKEFMNISTQYMLLEKIIPTVCGPVAAQEQRQKQKKSRAE